MSEAELDTELDLLARLAARPQEIAEIFQQLNDRDVLLLCDASKRARQFCARNVPDEIWSNRIKGLGVSPRNSDNYQLFREIIYTRLSLLRDILAISRDPNSYRDGTADDDAVRLKFDYTRKQALEIDPSAEIPRDVSLEGVIYFPKPAHVFLTDPILDVYEFGIKTDESVIPRRYISTLRELERVLEIRKPDSVNVAALTDSAERALRRALTKFYQY